MSAKDPVCGKEVDALRARAVGIFGGVTYYFCSAECKARFVDPRKAPRAELETEPKKAETKPKSVPAPTEPKSETTPPKTNAITIQETESEAHPDAPDPALDPDEPLVPAGTRSRLWVIALTLLAMGVVFFLLGRR